jgi:hypothetical protein
MDMFLVAGSGGGIVCAQCLSATTQANARKAVRHLDLMAALKAAF